MIFRRAMRPASRAPPLPRHLEPPDKIHGARPTRRGDRPGPAERVRSVVEQRLEMAEQRLEMVEQRLEMAEQRLEMAEQRLEMVEVRTARPLVIAAPEISSRPAERPAEISFERTGRASPGRVAGGVAGRAAGRVAGGVAGGAAGGVVGTFAGRAGLCPERAATTSRQLLSVLWAGLRDSCRPRACEL